jgi:hypothetical protein
MLHKIISSTLPHSQHLHSEKYLSFNFGNYIFNMGDDHEIEFHEIEIAIFMRSKILQK